jgi:hypothetical protein
MIATMMRRHRRHTQAHGPKERSVGRLALTFAGMVFVTAGFILTWLFLADRDLLFSAPSTAVNNTGQAEPAAPVMARYRFDRAELIAPTRLVTRFEKRTLGNVTKLDLLLPWPYQPGTVPRLPDTAAAFDNWLILTLDTGGKDELTPVERYGEIYPVYFEGEPERVEGNLLRYRFREGSPYADLVLYVANAGGEQVVHRCDKKPSVLGPILCERTIQLTSEIRLRLRFARRHLQDWAGIEQNVRTAMANMLRTVPGS